MTLVNKIGLGTVQFGLDYGISNKSGKTSIDEIKKILDIALSKGITILDTARSYGDAETVLGECNVSEKFKVVSKFISSDTETIDAQLQLSCEKLKTNHLYAYLAHRPVSIIKNKKEWDDLLELKEKGKVEKIGFSLNAVYEIEELLALNYSPDIIQVPYNYFDRRFEPTMIELKKQGCEIHTRSAFLQGLFFANTNELSVFFDEVKFQIKQLQDVYRNKLPKMLLKYVLSKPFIDSTIIGVEHSVQLKENIEDLNDCEELPENNFDISENILMPSQWRK